MRKGYTQTKKRKYSGYLVREFIEREVQAPSGNRYTLVTPINFSGHTCQTAIYKGWYERVALRPEESLIGFAFNVNEAMKVIYKLEDAA